MRKTMAQMVGASIGGGMSRFGLPPQLQAVSQRHFASLARHHILDGTSKAYPNLELNRKMADNWKMIGPPSSSPDDLRRDGGRRRRRARDKSAASGPLLKQTRVGPERTL